MDGKTKRILLLNEQENQLEYLTIDKNGNLTMPMELYDDLNQDGCADRRIVAWVREAIIEDKKSLDLNKQK